MVLGPHPVALSWMNGGSNLALILQDASGKVLFHRNWNNIGKDYILEEKSGKVTLSTRVTVYQ